MIWFTANSLTAILVIGYMFLASWIIQPKGLEDWLLVALATLVAGVINKIVQNEL